MRGGPIGNPFDSPAGAGWDAGAFPSPVRPRPMSRPSSRPSSRRRPAPAAVALAALLLPAAAAPAGDPPADAPGDPAAAGFDSPAAERAVRAYERELTAVREEAAKRRAAAEAALLAALKGAVSSAAADGDFAEVERLSAYITAGGPAAGREPPTRAAAGAPVAEEDRPADPAPADPAVLPDEPAAVTVVGRADAAKLARVLADRRDVTDAVLGRSYKVTFDVGTTATRTFRADGVLLQDGRPHSRWAPVGPDAVVTVSPSTGLVDLFLFAAGGARAEIVFMGAVRDERKRHTAVRLGP